ncbi:MAG: hypothetical protein EGQ71_00610 [Dialister sp.]|nr:hypothetical protein [Dialister sp.]
MNMENFTSVFNSADGPTSIFVAGKTPEIMGVLIAIVVVGVIISLFGLKLVRVLSAMMGLGTGAVIGAVYPFQLMTGMQVAEEIRAIDEDAWIIFLTTSRDHALESYNVFASGYVLKPLLENAPQLETLLTRLLPEDALAAKTLTVKLAGGECLSVPYSHILYMDCQGSRGAILHLEDRTLASQNSYQELADILLTDERFLETYHRLILNMNAVTAMKEDTFLLKGDLTLPISRRKKKEVKQQYMQFLLSR